MSPASTPAESLFEPLSEALIQGEKLIANATNWQEKYRQIMLLGKKLPSLAAEFRQESAQVKGCESQAWLYHRTINGKEYFVADSDARIVKGLIGLLLVATQGQSAEVIRQFDVTEYFNQLGLSGQLSPSRTNGLHALVQAMNDHLTR
ncbi:SufE family protein [Shewanella gaetbuli]|uniref:SufE family protein n=1 Tax=Shewanella gaetbuli TaxID=220752 RepID=A0A9X1ZF09_9GAMM|nr:SufE family protein [Shewanella gaetbuli]MCL1141159.1 SufE family protein [Shewanella gaetbuli]